MCLTPFSVFYQLMSMSHIAALAAGLVHEMNHQPFTGATTLGWHSSTVRSSPTSSSSTCVASPGRPLRLTRQVRDTCPRPLLCHPQRARTRRFSHALKAFATKGITTDKLVATSVRKLLLRRELNDPHLSNNHNARSISIFFFGARPGEVIKLKPHHLSRNRNPQRIEAQQPYQATFRWHGEKTLIIKIKPPTSPHALSIP